MSQPRDPALVKQIIIKMAISSFLIQLITLYSSEFFNCIYNNHFDALGLSFVDRLPLLFKPTVFYVFIGAYAFQLFIMMITLKPMFTYLQKGDEYSAARLSAIKLPWRIFLVQSITWILGTTVYFIIWRWHPESGLPYPLSILLKLSTGLMGAMFNSVCVSIYLLPAKRAMAIVDIRAGEYDHFIRNKNLIIVFCSTFIIAAHFFYLTYYLLNPHAAVASLFLSFGLWGAYFILVGLGLNILSKYEYNTQINYMKEHISRLLDSEMASEEDKVHLLYFDEIGEFASLFNQFMEKFRVLLDETSESALVLSSAVQNLSTTTKEVTSTSNMQAAAVKEVVSTMEDSNTITQSIGRSIPEVTRIALRTKEHVDSGMDIVHETAEKMTEIRKKNTDTISGIRSLTNKIRAIWEIVDIINTIVEQTRIIAFNAALEASTAGEAGKNFRIVAGEIKLLADSTTQSTAEIQLRITEIQKAANNLIVVSEEGTERIRQGHELSDKLNTVFLEILDSADISATSSESIENSIRQQASAFEQIVVTMKEISRGIDNLVMTQEQTARTAESLNSMAASLKAQAGKFTSEKKAEQ